MPFEQLIPRSFTRNAIQFYAPRTSGVYGISNSQEWIFIGAADNIHDALLNHLTDTGAPLMGHEPTGFVFECCDGALRPDRQSRLVSEYLPACNGRPPRPAQNPMRISRY